MNYSLPSDETKIQEQITSQSFDENFTPTTVTGKLSTKVLDQLTEECFQQRHYMQEKSHLLFTLKQNYLKKLEIYKNQKHSNQSKRQDYYQSIVSLALKDTELKYQRQYLLNQEIDWNNIFTEQLSNINDTRQTLQDILLNYRQLRQQISQFQHLFQFTTEDTRIHTLNSIVFCNYSKSIIDNEIRKNYLLNKLFQQKKEMMSSYFFYQEQLGKMKEQLKDYQINKINIFRRYERIYVGKSKELLEQQQLLATSGYQYQYFGLNTNESSQSSDNEDNNTSNHINSFSGIHSLHHHHHPNAPSRPNHSRPSIKRKSIKSNRKSTIDANNPAVPYVPYGPPTTSAPNFSNPFAIDNYGSQLNLLPPEEQQKIQAQQQHQQQQQQQHEEQQKDLSTSLMYQLMNSLDEEDEDEENNMVYNKDSLEHRVAKKILIMDMPELLAMNNNNNGKGIGGSNIGINAMSDDSLGVGEIHLPALKNDSKPTKGKGRSTKKGGKGEESNPPVANADNAAGVGVGRNRRLSIVQHGDFIQFVDRFNKSRYQNMSIIENGDDTNSNPNKSNNSSSNNNKKNSTLIDKKNFNDSMDRGFVTEKSSVLSFPEYPSNKKKKKKATKKDQANPIIIYDPQAFAESCSGDYIRPNTILEVNKGIGEREERLITLVDNCCVAKGKVKQLTAIKEVS